MSTVIQPNRSTTTRIPDALYEVIDGVFVEKSVGADESLVAGFLYECLADYAREHRNGRPAIEVLFQMDAKRDRQRRPDVAFVTHERWPKESRRVGPVWKVAPDLAVEVISPNEIFNDVQDKIYEYFEVGVRLCWLISLKRATVSVYTSPTDVRIFKIDETLNGGDVLPGFQVALGDLFSGGAAE